MITQTNTDDKKVSWNVVTVKYITIYIFKNIKFVTCEFSIFFMSLLCSLFYRKMLPFLFLLKIKEYMMNNE